jgi:predicted dehydrogenase
MERELHMAVIGTGMGRYHMKGFTACPGVTLDAVCDLNVEEAQSFGAEYGAKRVFRDYRELWSLPGLDAVGIAIPNYLHAAVAIEAMEAGLHVLCEKPMATSAADARRMLETAERTGKRLMIDMSNRFRPPSLAAHRLLTEGGLGDVYYARSTWIRRRGMPVVHFGSGGSMGRGPWFVSAEKAGGGALFDIGVHVFDLTWWLMGAPRPTRVLASTYRNLENDWFREHNIPCDVDELTAAMVQFDNGATAFFDVSWVANYAENFNVRIMGTAAGLQFDPPTVFRGERDAYDDQPIAVLPEDELSAYRHFVDCIRQPDKPMIASGQECYPVIQVLDAIRESAQTGREAVIC